HRHVRVGWSLSKSILRNPGGAGDGLDASPQSPGARRGTRVDLLPSPLQGGRGRSPSPDARNSEDRRRACSAPHRATAHILSAGRPAFVRKNHHSPASLGMAMHPILRFSIALAAAPGLALSGARAQTAPMPPAISAAALRARLFAFADDSM